MGAAPSSHPPKLPLPFKIIYTNIVDFNLHKHSVIFKPGQYLILNGKGSSNWLLSKWVQSCFHSLFFVTGQSSMTNIFGPFQVFWFVCLFVLLFLNIVVEHCRTTSSELVGGELPRCLNTFNLFMVAVHYTHYINTCCILLTLSMYTM